MDSQTLMVVLITVVVCALIGVVVWIAARKARSRQLKEHFGPEYDHVVNQMKNQNVAEAELQNRERRVEKFSIVPLVAQERAYYRQAWGAVQNRFVDDPQEAVQEGDRLIFEVMEKRGYPVNGFEQAATDLSVEYPTVVSNYRAANAIAKRNRAGEAGTEELRQAVVHYRALFHELLEAPAFTAAKPESATSRFGNRFQFPKLRKSRRGGAHS